MAIDEQIQRLETALEERIESFDPASHVELAEILRLESAVWMLYASRSRRSSKGRAHACEYSKRAAQSASAAATVIKARLAEDVLDIEDQAAKNERIRAKMRALGGGLHNQKAS